MPLFLDAMSAALGLDAPGLDAPDGVQILNEDQAAPSWFATSELANASIAAAGLALRRLTGRDATVVVDQRLAAFWFATAIQPEGWSLPPIWDAIAGDYRTADGWIRLHTNAPHHRAAALEVLGQHPDRAALAPRVADWKAEALEAAIVAAGGCAAAMRNRAAWAAHPQGAAIAAEPLIHWDENGASHRPSPTLDPARPLTGLRVLDLTRVLAGPVAGRFLAAYGADVLRIDPPDWEEPAVVPDVTLGKRCAGLDLKQAEDRTVFEQLLASADILLHGYRPGALAALGYDRDALQRLSPGLIDVTLCAYGWTGPWSLAGNLTGNLAAQGVGRRGFDSLVQMSSGIAAHGMVAAGADKPTPLPFQALDHATGYLMAAAALRALDLRRREGVSRSARLSLARTAALLSPSARNHAGPGMPALTEADIDPTIEPTSWGPARRVRFPLAIAGTPAHWDCPASALRSAPAAWRARF